MAEGDISQGEGWLIGILVVVLIVWFATAFWQTGCGSGSGGCGGAIHRRLGSIQSGLGNKTSSARNANSRSLFLAKPPHSTGPITSTGSAPVHPISTHVGTGEVSEHEVGELLGINGNSTTGMGRVHGLASSTAGPTILVTDNQFRNDVAISDELMEMRGGIGGRVALRDAEIPFGKASSRQTGGGAYQMLLDALGPASGRQQILPQSDACQKHCAATSNISQEARALCKCPDLPLRG